MTTPAPVVGDAFGLALQKCWEAGAMAGAAYQIIERDDGYTGATDVAAYFNPPERWAPLERLAVERAVGRVIDVGCGAGRHAVGLRERGLAVVGLEPSADAAAVGRARGVEVVEAVSNGRQSRWPRFDTLLLMGNNVGLLGGRDGPAGAGQPGAAPGPRPPAMGTDPYATTAPGHLACHE